MRKKNLAVFLIVLCSSLAYFTSVFNDFVYDDHLVLTNNRLIKDIRNMPRLFTHDYFLVSRERTFRPFSPFMLFCQYAVFADNPAGYHAVNVLVHTANGILLFLLLLSLGYYLKTSLLASLIFCLHPAISETVFCVSYMEDLWGMLFYLCTFLCFIRTYKSNHKWLFFALVQVCFFLSLLCKEMGITAFILIPLMSLMFNNKKEFSKTNVKGFLIPSIISIIFYAVLRFYVFYMPEKQAAYPGGSFFVTLANIPRIFLHYIRLCVLPVKLTADYNIKVYSDILSFPVVLSYVLIAALIFLFFRLSLKNRFWALFIFINFLPVSNIIPFGATLAERYLYFPIIGFSVLTAVFIQDLNKSVFKFVKLNNRVNIAAANLIILFFTALIIERAPVWKSDNSLWLKTFKNSPKSFTEKATFYVNLGNAFYRKNELDNALNAYLKAKQINPGLPGLYNNIGVIYLEKGQHDIAKSYFFKAIERDDSLEGTYFSLFKLYMREKNYGQAEKIMLDLIAKKNGSVKALDNLTTLYNDTKNYERALQCVEKIISIDPKDERAYLNGYIIAMTRNQPDLAEQFLIKGIKELPRSIKLKNSLAEKYRLTGDLKRSLSITDKLLSKNNANARTYEIRGVIYYSLKQPELSKLNLEKSLKLKPEQVKVLNNLGLIYFEQGELNKARQCWMKSLELNPYQKDIKKSLDYVNSKK